MKDIIKSLALEIDQLRLLGVVVSRLELIYNELLNLYANGQG